MAFPDLQFDDAEAVYHASAEGVPDNGDNVIKVPFRPGLLEWDKLVVNYIPLGSGASSVTAAHVVSIDPGNNEITINFTQLGTSAIRLEVSIEHSIVH